MGWNKLRIIVNLGVLALIIALALPACIKLWRNRKDPAALKAILLRHKKLLIFLGLLALYFLWLFLCPHHLVSSIAPVGSVVIDGMGYDEVTITDEAAVEYLSDWFTGNWFRFDRLWPGLGWMYKLSFRTESGWPLGTITLTKDYKKGRVYYRMMGEEMPETSQKTLMDYCKALIECSAAGETLPAPPVS
ncbi:MAG: hypothetical protein LUF91_08195 [Oscillospiraceae bacterium]|nr:hypothetical protein [Oscillospiraceae bacterium]